MRIRAIDTFRGLSIVLMVFFTMLFRLSNRLPDILMHNVKDSLHIGDFVLPMFLFASGMSIVFFARKRQKLKRSTYILDVIERFGKLALIAVILSPFSAAEFFGMDEVMLSALLFLPSLFLIRYSEKVIACVALAVFLFYLGLQNAAMLPDFTQHYLGGYPAAVFYLPVMLCGVIAGKRINEIEKLLAVLLPVTVLFLLVVPPCKACATPSFMLLSVVFSLAVYLVVRGMENRHLQYLGQKPIRYWVLMFAVLIVPVTFYAAATESPFPLPLSWIEALVITMACMPVLYLISRAIDSVQEKKSYFNYHAG